jgi:hypothetical protein
MTKTEDPDTGSESGMRKTKDPDTGSESGMTNPKEAEQRRQSLPIPVKDIDFIHTLQN